MLKKIVLMAALAGTCPLSHGQTNENPFSFEASYVGDTYYNAAGGLRTGGGYMGMANLRAGFDTEKAGWWRGGSFFVNGAGIHGKSLSENYSGDLQVASNIDAGEHVYLHELWFQQRLGGLTLTAGLQDLNAEFMATDGGGEFLNSSFGIPPVLAVNLPVPIFPLTGLGFTARWDIGDRLAWQATVFDGCPTPFAHNPYNLDWTFSKNDGVLAAMELHLYQGAGTYKLGAWYHSELREFDRETQTVETVFKNNLGFYGMIDQPVGERLGLFAQAAVAPKKQNANNYYLGAGANYTFGERSTAGLAVAHAGLHSTSHRHETTLEFYYKYRLNDNIAIQPDVQYILNPSGTDEPLKNALAGILRLHVTF